MQSFKVVMRETNVLSIVADRDDNLKEDSLSSSWSHSAKLLFDCNANSINSKHIRVFFMRQMLLRCKLCQEKKWNRIWLIYKQTSIEVWPSISNVAKADATCALSAATHLRIHNIIMKYQSPTILLLICDWWKWRTITAAEPNGFLFTIW